MSHIPFNGDSFISGEIRKLIEKWKIKTIVETGTWSAHSTREFAKMGPRVITIDATWNHLIEEFGPKAIEDLQSLGIQPVLGDSSKCLSAVIHDFAYRCPILFYLDAHGGGENNSNVNPFLEELSHIADNSDCEDNCVIVIHDFQVPGKEWGHNGGDWGKGWQPLSYGLIRQFLEEIYPEGHSYHYNQEADGATRGVIYIYPRGEVNG